MFDCTTAKVHTTAVGTSKATHNRNRLKGDKFDTDRTNQTGKTGLGCFVVFVSIPKESEMTQPLETVSPQRVFGI